MLDLKELTNEELENIPRYVEAEKKRRLISALVPGTRVEFKLPGFLKQGERSSFCRKSISSSGEIAYWFITSDCRKIRVYESKLLETVRLLDLSEGV